MKKTIETKLWVRKEENYPDRIGLECGLYAVQGYINRLYARKKITQKSKVLITVEVR